VAKIKSQLAVVEGKWQKRANVSVRSLFDILADINFGTPHAYIYEMFCDAHALSNIISRMGSDDQVRYLYIGAHGSITSVSGSGGDVSRTKLKNSLVSLLTNNHIIEGLFLGTCFFGNEENASFLLTPRNNPNPPIKWVAGYSTSIDWIDSSVLDLLFWNKFFAADGTPVERISSVAEQLLDLAPGLVRDLGFCIYARRRGRNGGIRNLMARDEEA
jgi:hypothetical protein